MPTSFVVLNDGWNADPNAPEPLIERHGSDLRLSFRINAFQYPQFAEGQVASIRFLGCWRHRLGATNDEGWYMGQCRFSRLAPAWGEFYEVTGDLLLEAKPLEWLSLVQPPPTLTTTSSTSGTAPLSVMPHPSRSRYRRMNPVWPNPSIERTDAGKPASAAHVER